MCDVEIINFKNNLFYNINVSVLLKNDEMEPDESIFRVDLYKDYQKSGIFHNHLSKFLTWIQTS